MRAHMHTHAALSVLQGYSVGHLQSHPQCQMLVLQSVKLMQSQGWRARLRTELLTKHAVPKQLGIVSLNSFDDFY